MTLSFEELLSNHARYTHHALLLVNPSFAEQGLQAPLFASLALTYCGIRFAHNPEDASPDAAEEFWAECARHPDVFIAVRERPTLRLEDMAKVRELVLYPPTVSRRRLVFIDRCERLGTSAANAFLKVLEEPPTSVLFVLTARRADQVLTTIASRCHKIPLALPKQSAQKRGIAALESADRAWLQAQFIGFERSQPQAIESTWDFYRGKLSFEKMRDLTERCEALGKNYEATQLQDALIELVRDALVKSPEEGLVTARFVQADLSRWKDAEAFHPSSQLWLLRILLRLAAKK